MRLNKHLAFNLLLMVIHLQSFSFERSKPFSGPHKFFMENLPDTLLGSISKLYSLKRWNIP